MVDSQHPHPPFKYGLKHCLRIVITTGRVIGVRQTAQAPQCLRMFISKFSPVDADVLRVQNKALVIFACSAQAPGELAPRVYGLKVFLTLVFNLAASTPRNISIASLMRLVE